MVDTLSSMAMLLSAIASLTSRICSWKIKENQVQFSETSNRQTAGQKFQNDNKPELKHLKSKEFPACVEPAENYNEVQSKGVI